MSLIEELESRIICGDGAIGTLLMDRGVPGERCLEELCVSDPDLVRGIHDEYIAAGARVIETHSFGANGVRLSRFGLEGRVNEINWSAAQIARQSARGKDVYVAGSVGPLGITAQEAETQGIDREAVFREQIGALLDGGAQLLFFETFTTIDELQLALYVKQSLHHCPAVCSLFCPEGGYLISGIALAAAFRELRDQDADVVGVNCTNGPEAALRLLRTAPVSPGELVCAYPNAGAPHFRDGRFVYPATPEDFATAARDLVKEGACLIGGCCGTTPAHIRAISQAVAHLRVPTDRGAL